MILKRLLATCKLIKSLEESQTRYWKCHCEAVNLNVPIARFDFDWRRCYIDHMRELEQYISSSTSRGNGRLLVLSPDFSVNVHSPNGDWSVPLRHGPGEVYGRITQPTWSRNGRYVAWSRIAAQVSDQASSFVDVVDSVTGAKRCWAVTNLPFYFYWSPDSTRIIYLCADDSLKTHFIDLFETPESANEDDLEDHTPMIYSSSAHFFSYCPIPGVDRILGNVPGSETYIMGLTTSPSSIRLSLDSQYAPTLSTPDAMPPAPFQLWYEGTSDDLSLAPYTTPFWTCNNTMVMATLKVAERPTIQITAFDAIWNPKYEETRLTEVYADGGLESVARLMQSHPAEEDVQLGLFELPIPATAVSVFESSNRVKFVVSPNGRLVCCLSSQKVEIIRLLFENDTTNASSSRAESKFLPLKVIGKKVVYTAATNVFGVFFAPNSLSILFLRRDGERFLWNSLELPESDEQKSIVEYAPFEKSPILMHHYLPFNAQYATSMQIHSPDSTHFAYSADEEIWIQKLHFGAGPPPQPSSLASGLFCAWSPV